MLENQANNIESNEDTALGWISRFRSGTASDSDHQEFALWLAQDPGHKRAMDAMLDMWSDLASVRQLYSDVPQSPPTSSANSSKWFGASIAAVASLVLALVIWPQSNQHTTDSIRYQTALGEQQTIELEDGSTVTLNTDSRLEVSFDESRRALHLIQGEAFFEVAKDPARPFDVDAGSALVTAVGTAFNIYRSEQGSSVTVAEGVVRVTELGDTGSRAPSTEILRANQQLTATSLGLQTAVAANVSRQTAWQRGELIAQDMPLAQLIQEIERYHATHILITDSGIAALTITGVFSLSELEPILQALQVSLGIKAVPVNDNTLQLVRASEAI